ncbi:uracil-DNA glycosylase [Haloarchaeobius sp. TZWWS8]|uniref:uracil-DNA glycosylase n=1 Tax=Haloarchaeobius sp. TZWWS8 TaxID=3446121 RepID=UPI003EBC9140
MENMDGLCVTECKRCPRLVESRSRIVNGVGPDDADVLFVGEAPGAQEDAEGEPFVGRSGDVLTDVLRTVGLDRETVRITNCVRCRPPDNRDPRKQELANCRDYLEEEISLVDPEVIVTLGKVPGEHLLGRSIAVTKETGTVEEVRIGDEPRRVLLCLHPAATLYDRSQREPFEETLATASSLAGVEREENESGQSRLGEF